MIDCSSLTVHEAQGRGLLHAHPYDQGWYEIMARRGYNPRLEMKIRFIPTHPSENNPMGLHMGSNIKEISYGELTAHIME